MSKISVRRRRFQIRKDKKRQGKLKKLRLVLSGAKTEKGKKEALEKMKRISPHICGEEFAK